MIMKWMNEKDPGRPPSLELYCSKYGLACGSAAKASPGSLRNAEPQAHPRPTEWKTV